MIVGGFAPTPLKKLNGAKFATPSSETVETQAIGRGVINRTIQLYKSRLESSAVFNCIRLTEVKRLPGRYPRAKEPTIDGRPAKR